MTKLYLDIDGTLVGRGGVPAQGLTEFLRFATEAIDPPLSLHWEIVVKVKERMLFSFLSLYSCFHFVF